MARDRASRPEAKPLRLFIAVDISDEARGALEAALAPLRAGHPEGRWVPSANWHVTLKFLGATYPRLVEGVRATLADVAAAHAPLESALEGIGTFPTGRKARVLWAGLRDPGGALAAIAADLDARLARDFRPEDRGFTAHLTVARFDPPAVVSELSPVEVPPVAFLVDRLVLYRSHLRRPAPVYEPLTAARLGSGEVVGEDA